MSLQTDYEKAALENVAINTQRVVQTILGNGVEFEIVCNCVLVWAAKTRGIAFRRAQVWHVWQTNGLRILNADGDNLIFRTFHELLQWLFDQPEITGDDDPR